MSLVVTPTDAFARGIILQEAVTLRLENANATQEDVNSILKALSDYRIAFDNNFKAQEGFERCYTLSKEDDFESVPNTYSAKVAWERYAKALETLTRLQAEKQIFALIQASVHP